MDFDRITHGGEGATPAGLIFSMVCGVTLASSWAINHKDDLSSAWHMAVEAYQLGAVYSIPVVTEGATVPQPDITAPAKDASQRSGYHLKSPERN